MTRKERYRYIIDFFDKELSDVTTELEYGNHFQLLVAVILSAQCTDKRVNSVTPTLFKAYPTAFEMQKATEQDVFAHIKSVSYPNSKAKHIVETAKILVEKFNGKVPCEEKKLISLPGVGRKTANVMMAVAFKKPAMPVDTHVFRVSKRLGLVSGKADNPKKVEDELVKNIPQKYLSNMHHWLLLHGRYMCKSNKPLCEKCEFENFCPKLLKNSKLS